MSRNANANLRELEHWAARLKGRVAPEAVRAGQKVIAAALKARAPRRLRGSIEVRRVGQGPEFVGGFVVVNHRAARRIERQRPFVEPTFEHDGPEAAKAMIEVLRKELR